MELRALLELDKTQASIKKIDSFLKGSVKLSDEYVIALSYKGLILHKLNKSNEALRLVLPLANDFKIMGSNAVISACDLIITIYLDDNRFDEASKYINLKKNFLPASKLHLYLKDKIRFFLKKDDKPKAKEALLAYLSDDLIREDAIEAKEKLSEIYFLEKEYDKYLALTPALEAYYKENVMLERLGEIDLRRLEITFSRKNYLKVIADGNKFLEETSLVNHILRCAALCIRAYIELQDYKKAGIFESYYEDFATDEHIEEALEFSYAALDLYNRTNSIVSADEYKRRIKELEDKLAPKEKRRVKAKKDNELLTISIPAEAYKRNESIITPSKEILNPTPIINKAREVINTKPERIMEVVVSKGYKKLFNIAKEINNMNPDISFRELYRKSLIEVKKLFNISEAYLLYSDKNSYHGLYFKKDRAYDRSLLLEDIENTISYQASVKNEELTLLNTSDSYNIDIRTNTSYSGTEGFLAVPLQIDGMVASITYIGEADFLNEEMSYEALMLITELLKGRFILDCRDKKREQESLKLSFLIDNMHSGLKEECDNLITLNKKAQEIFNLPSEVNRDILFSLMKNEDIIAYKSLINKLYLEMPLDKEIEYDLRVGSTIKRINEQFYPVVSDGVVSIYSIIRDITKEFRDKRNLIELAYKNPVSNTETELKLDMEITREMKNERMSLAYIEPSDFSLYKEIYGGDFERELILALAIAFKKALANDFNLSLYHMERDRYAILFKDMNDKRQVDLKLKEIFNKASNELLRINKRLNISFRAGVFRLLRNTRVDSASMIKGFALEALEDSKELKDMPYIAHYDNEIKHERMKREMLVTHISEAIDSNKLSLTYQQIVDIEKKEVYAYNAIINLDNLNIDRDLMDYVIDRRGLRIRIDKYSIRSLIREERMLYEELRGYIPMFIEIKRESCDLRLYDYINTLINHYKIKREYLVIITDSTSSLPLEYLRRDGVKLCSKNIIDIYKNSCDYFIYELDILGTDMLEEIASLSLKHNITMIIGGVDNEEDLKYCLTNGYNLIYGAIYKKLNRIDSIIKKINS